MADGEDPPPPSAFDVRHAVRADLNQIFAENLFGANDSPPLGHLRWIDVLPPVGVQHKITRACKGFAGGRGRLACFARPRSFFEKLTAAKYFAPLPMPVVADKLNCGAFIPRDLRDDVKPIEVIAQTDQPITEEVLARFALKPGRYYVKANAGSGTNIPIQVPMDPAVATHVEERTQAWLQAEHGARNGEWWYGQIRKQNFIEPDCSKEGESLTDWKFHVAGARVIAVQVDLDRATAHRQIVLDRYFVPQEGPFFFETGPPPEKPKQYGRMVDIAEAIGATFSYARVDLYLVQDQIYLGEITLAPMGGVRLPRSEALDMWMGQTWREGLFGTD